MQLNEPCHGSVQQQQLLNYHMSHMQIEASGTIMVSTCDLPLLWLSPTIGKFATARSAAQEANPRGRSSNFPLPEKCQLWLQGLPFGTVCPRLAAPAPLTCAFACQPLLHIAPKQKEKKGFQRS